MIAVNNGGQHWVEFREVKSVPLVSGPKVYGRKVVRELVVGLAVIGQAIQYYHGETEAKRIIKSYPGWDIISDGGL